MSEYAHLLYNDIDQELPLVSATEGNDGFDISKLRSSTGKVTYDYGYANTASCQSAITYIDGESGILRYRGYPIEQLAEKSTFLETSYLVLNGELPTVTQLKEFEDKIQLHTVLDERMREMFRYFPRKSHPMPVLSAGITALGTYSTESTGYSQEQMKKATITLMGKVPTLAAYGYKNSMGQPTLFPDDSLSYIENFLRMSFGTPTHPYEFDDRITRALDVLLILHADHEQNCSSSTVRLVGSSGANIYVSVASGVNALSGPLHGGANQAVLDMLWKIYDSGINVKTFIQQVKDKKSGIKLMGFGHRIYRNYDPRAAIIKKHADEILTIGSGRKELLDIAVTLEEAATNDPYFQERKLYPNVDFYSGLIYEAMGFPVDMFTVLFALGRLPGWIAQWREQRSTETQKIGRPRQVYIGKPKRDYISISQR